MGRAHCSRHGLSRQAGRIAAIHYRDSKGKDARLTARAFVIAGHALETPKPLLMSGAANSSDPVGRNLMDHTGTNVNFLSREPVWMGRGPVQQARIMNWRNGAFRARHSALKHDVHNANPVMALAPCGWKTARCTGSSPTWSAA